VQSGDVTSSSATVWCRAEESSRSIVEWSTSPQFARVTSITGPVVGPDTDFVAKVGLVDLPEGTLIHYRMRFESTDFAQGSFRTPSSSPRDVMLAWSADTNGQGWGIDPSRGGMPTYKALLDRAPDLFVHCGDAIYADGPIPETIALAGGGVWRNVVDPLKAHVAETLTEFRGAHRYPRGSAEVRAASAAIPLFSIWDDHEIRNNWFPGEVLDDTRYTERHIDALAVHARRAMYEYAPTLRDPNGPMYRVVNWGPLLDVFLLDGRAYRSPNESERPGGLLGSVQAAWLVAELARSRAAWKIVACDMPIAVVVAEPGKTVARANDGWANGNGEPREREVELATILSELRARHVKNIVWVTADVHYAAAHHLTPERAAFKDFDPFWELVAGPMHAASLPAKPLDDTFGPEVAWTSAKGTVGSPATGEQSFGLLTVDGKSRDLRVTFVDAHGRDLHRFVIPYDAE
jgi:alkaline phosphatase D